MKSVLMVSSVALVGAQSPSVGTVSGENCAENSQCAATPADEFNCHQCSIDSLGTVFRNCKYGPDLDFEAMTSTQKMSLLWDNIIEETQPATFFEPQESFRMLFTDDAHKSFDNPADELPPNRPKTIHTVGAHCKFNLTVAPDSPYTGLFASGLQEGLIRLGSSGAFLNGFHTPGLGMKFPRTGVHSGDFVALHSLGFLTKDFFGWTQSNHLPAPTVGPLIQLSHKFRQASVCPVQVGLSDMSRYSQNGTEHANPVFPFKVLLIPTEATQNSTDVSTVEELNEQMKAFNVGTPLYSMYACGRAGGDENNPTTGGLDNCADAFKLGDIVTTSQCTTSKYGDEKLHIKHQRIEEDWAADPSILGQYNATQACGWGSQVMPTESPKKCSAPMPSKLATSFLHTSFLHKAPAH